MKQNQKSAATLLPGQFCNVSVEELRVNTGNTSDLLLKKLQQ